jgi:MYXO-CTERM domain-containing protein
MLVNTKPSSCDLHRRGAETTNMKSITLLTAAILACLASTASAQLVIHGAVRDPGTGVSTDPVRITLTIDPNTGGTPGDNSYLATAQVERGGLLLPPVNSVNLQLFDGSASLWGLRAQTPTAFDVPAMEIMLHNRGPAIPVTATSFPEGIPMNLFLVKQGFYNYPGQGFEFFVTGYTGSFNARPSPVPEPSTYGLAAVLGLAGLVVWRRSSTVKG